MRLACWETCWKLGERLLISMKGAGTFHSERSNWNVFDGQGDTQGDCICDPGGGTDGSMLLTNATTFLHALYLSSLRQPSFPPYAPP